MLPKPDTCQGCEDEDFEVVELDSMSWPRTVQCRQCKHLYHMGPIIKGGALDGWYISELKDYASKT